MAEIYCIYQKMSTISVIMETMFVIAMRTLQLRFTIQTYSDRTPPPAFFRTKTAKNPGWEGTE